MSKDNFKDDFERNRQEIKPNQSEPTHKETDQDETSFDVKDEHQHFPPRNASRRHRKRDLGQPSDVKAHSDNNDEQTSHEGQGKRPGILGGFVNKKSSSHDDQRDVQTQSHDQASQRGEKIRDYAKDDAQVTRHHTRDDGRPEHHGGRHREQIQYDDTPKTESETEHADRKHVGTQYSSSTSPSNDDTRERTRNISASPKEDQHRSTNLGNETLDKQSKQIDANHRHAKRHETTQEDVHTSQRDLKGKKVATGAATAGVAGASAKHHHDKKEAQRHNQNDVDSRSQEDAHRDPKHDDRQKHNGKKVAAGATAAGVAGAAAKHHHDKKEAQRHNQNDVDSRSQEDAHREPKHDDRQKHNGKKVAAGAVAAGVAGAAAKHHHDKKENHNRSRNKALAGTGAATGANHGHGHDNHGKEKRGGCLKRIIPLLAALLLLGALAIFGGMYLFNQGNDDNHDKGKQTEVAKNDKAKDKETKDKEADKDKAQKDNASKDKNSNEDATSQSNDPSQQNNQQNGMNQQGQTPQNQQNQNTQNQNQQNQQNQAGGQSHTVSGNENLYRIAIRYYGNGSPENVEKIRRANGISGNNISNGQHLIIP
ncbi:LysM peptidoglycan-binding domain-containing protein [Staphylococcus agnetis]|uniref:LysM peptidoglycan-binding domain-containing protein n=1 Tax=Staphylococcus agnetis TaxID=985762 RepID=UPI00208FDC84|nr:LysM peptidoglycan-binding domain-containing protein [Staphylococcus agnetis]MCO4350466.1 LysM peptidoglycan-binding domain-containing protein [Staphylococcus agnetis]MCO4354761.1 LysM peptidoglycan-binding domain-containing protein [Staphylococcus agnetis]MCO4359426.1 LysM peptidoglycan-binding domain-containing protein [Staphylococcus agnetis]MCO4364719.1 LysM peptidoglycan-binding domain-containing protein [Staphylococcus agnetis]MCO4371181.1 LysM peptidoglycan-binding domain-containing 